MLLGLPLAEESPVGLVVHPFWVVASIVNFLLLLFLLRRYLWGPINAVLEERAAKIREGLAVGEENRRERERIIAESEALLTKARQEAQAIAERTTKVAEEAANDIVAKTRADAARLLERARAEADQMYRQQLAELRSEIAGLAVLAARRILEKEIDEEAHRRLVEETVQEAAPQMGAARR